MNRQRVARTTSPPAATTAPRTGKKRGAAVLDPHVTSVPLFSPTVQGSAGHPSKKLKPNPLPSGAGASKDDADLAVMKAKAKAKADAHKDFGKGHDEFYRRMIALTDASRGTGPLATAAATEVERIATRWETDPFYKKEAAKRVRVKAKKHAGSKAGYGLHELIPTSETPYILRWSGGLLDGRDGKPAKKTNTFTLQHGGGKSTEMSLIAAQQWYRTETARVIWKTGEGHSGALRTSANAKSAWFTEGQAPAHDVLRAVLRNTLTAENVIPNLAHAHVETTATEPDMDTNLNKGWDVRGRDAAVPGDKVNMKHTFLAQRDFNKQVAEVLHERIPKGRDASPRRRETRPLSPLRGVSLYPPGSAEAGAAAEGALRRNFGPADTSRLMLREAAPKPRRGRARARSVSPRRPSPNP